MIIWLIFLTLACANVTSAADAPSSQQEDAIQSAESSSAPTAEPSATQGPLDPTKSRQRLRELDRRLSVLESVVVGRGHGRG
ncbi:hypothetical protein, partial [Petrachloros mirabilis]